MIMLRWIGAIVLLVSCMGATTAPDTRLSELDASFWRAASLEGQEQERALEACISKAETWIREQDRTPRSPADQRFLSAVHAELARALGHLALHRGPKAKVELGRRIKAEAEQALALDPRNALGHAVLGKWNYEVASLGWPERTLGNLLFGKIPEGSFETAAAELRKSIELDPSVIYTRLMLAQTLLKLGDRPGARHELELLVRQPPREKPDPSYIQEARRMLDGAP